MKALVTGGLGLIGSHIVMRLLKDGHQVRVLDIRPKEEFSLGKLPEEVEFLQGDVANLYDCHQAVQGIEMVFHTAAIARTVETIEEPLRAHAVNATGTLNLLITAQKNGVKRFVHSSSSILYVPNTPYFVGKQCAESYASIWGDLYHFSTISLRYANVYGKGQRRDGAYPNVLAAFARSKEEQGFIVVDGDGSQNRSFIHVDDVVEANMLAAACDVRAALDIGTRDYTSIKEISSWFDCPVKHGPPRAGDIHTIGINAHAAEVLIGFTAKVRFSKQSIQDYL